MGLFDSIGNVVGDVLGPITGATQQAEAIRAGGELQAAASAAGVEETKRQFDKLVELMAPFVGGGTRAFGEQVSLLGLEGPTAQQDLISNISGSPLFKELLRQGETSLLQNASATGGLRGGNIQSALAQFSPQLLNQQIMQRFSQLGSLANIGQASAAGQASAGQQFGSDISNLIQNAATARAGGVVAAGGVPRQAFSDLVKYAPAIAGLF